MEKYKDTAKLVEEGETEKALENYNQILTDLKRGLSAQVAKQKESLELEQQKQELRQQVAYGVAELYYKGKDYQRGLQHLDQMLSRPQELSAEAKFNFRLLKGKSHDMLGDYRAAAEVFAGNLKEYVQNIVEQGAATDAQQREVGNLEFRYGWSLIRSKQDIEQGVQQLREAEKKMPENQDLKVKLAQILFQE